LALKKNGTITITIYSLLTCSGISLSKNNTITIYTYYPLLHIHFNSLPTHFHFSFQITLQLSFFQFFFQLHRLPAPFFLTLQLFPKHPLFLFPQVVFPIKKKSSESIQFPFQFSLFSTHITIYTHSNSHFLQFSSSIIIKQTLFLSSHFSFFYYIISILSPIKFFLFQISTCIFSHHFFLYFPTTSISIHIIFTLPITYSIFAFCHCHSSHSSHCHIPIPAGIALVTCHLSPQSLSLPNPSWDCFCHLSPQSLSLPNPSWDSYVTQHHFLVTLIYNLAKFHTLHHSLPPLYPVHPKHHLTAHSPLHRFT